MSDIVSNIKARILCPQCDKTYSNKSGVKGHMKTKHVDSVITAKQLNTEEQDNEETPIDLLNLNINELENLL